MRCGLFLLLCIQLLPMSLDRQLLSQGLALQHLQDVEGVDGDTGNSVEVKYHLKLGKGPYGGANMNHDPSVSKSNAPSSHESWAFGVNIGVNIGFGLFMLVLFGF